MTDAQIIRCEERFMNAWPSLTTFLYEGCVMRMAGGYTKRANSISPLYADLNKPERLIKAGEQYFAQKKLPAVFKIPEGNRYAALDAMLADRGYAIADRTHVMQAQLGHQCYEACPEVIRGTDFDESWLAASAQPHGEDEHKALMKQMLSLIVPEKIVATALIDGQPAGCGYGVIENNDVSLAGIIVRPSCRLRGLGTQIMQALLGTAAEKGAATAWLQVVASNTGALRLYEKLNFFCAYDYWYRMQNR